jgi:histidine triad (HIT) family protein
MAAGSVFTKIIERELPADIVYEDDLVIAFRDIRPQAPVHVLIVPKEPIPTAADVTEEHEPALGRLFVAARRIAEQEGLQHGFRLIVNCKEHGHQEVYHLHLHLLGGEPIGPMRVRR